MVCIVLYSVCTCLPSSQALDSSRTDGYLDNIVLNDDFSNVYRTETDSGFILKEIELLMRGLENMEYLWSAFFKHRSDLSDSRTYKNFETKLNRLLFDTVPNVLDEVKCLHLFSNYLQRRYILDVPAVSRLVRVFTPSVPSVPNRTDGKFNWKSNLILNSTTKSNKYTLLGAKFQSNQVVKGPVNSRKADHLSKRLQNIKSAQNKLIKRLTVLQTQLNEFTRSRSHYEDTHSKITELKQQIHQLEDFKSELYYKRLTLYSAE